MSSFTRFETQYTTDGASLPRLMVGHVVRFFARTAQRATTTFNAWFN